jgi:hypothetical protein
VLVIGFLPWSDFRPFRDEETYLREISMSKWPLRDGFTAIRMDRDISRNFTTESCRVTAKARSGAGFSGWAFI